MGALSRLSLIPLFMLAACESGLQGMQTDLTPVATVKVQVGALPEGVDGADLNLRVGIIWASVTETDSWCIDNTLGAVFRGEDELAEDALPPSQVALAGCRDPFALNTVNEVFREGLGSEDLSVSVSLGPSVPLPHPPGEVEIPLLHLPSSDLMVGAPQARILYGGVIVYDDRDQSGDLGVVAFEQPIEPGERDEAEDEVVDAHVRFFDDAEDIYAATFYSAAAPSTRLVLREGDFDAASFYYPIIGCAAPPRGFSWLDVEGELGASVCESSPVDQAIEVPLTGPRPEYDALLCPAIPTAATLPPKEVVGLEDLMYECREPGVLVVTDPESRCQAVTRYVLLRCPANELECDDPDWDVSPPDWWPCAQDLEP